MHSSCDAQHFEQAFHGAYRNVCSVKMINNPISWAKELSEEDVHLAARTYDDSGRTFFTAMQPAN